MAEIMVRYDDLRLYCEKRHCGSVPLEYIKQMPTVEAEPAQHSILIKIGNDFVCGKCATTHRGRREDIRYCMRCGCKFDLGTSIYPDDYYKDDDGSGVGQTFSPD